MITLSMLICFLLVDTMSHWFRHISEGEPCDTYLKLSSGDLARTSEMIKSQRSTFDGDDALCVQNLQSIADYIHSAVVSSLSLLLLYLAVNQTFIVYYYLLCLLLFINRIY